MDTFYTKRSLRCVPGASSLVAIDDRNADRGHFVSVLTLRRRYGILSGPTIRSLITVSDRAGLHVRSSRHRAIESAAQAVAQALLIDAEAERVRYMDVAAVWIGRHQQRRTEGFRSLRHLFMRAVDSAHDYIAVSVAYTIAYSCWQEYMHDVGLGDPPVPHDWMLQARLDLPHATSVAAFCDAATKECLALPRSV